MMKQYKLPVILRQPDDDTENMYLAEVPSLPGCRAWGNTPPEAMEYLQDVANKFILSYKEHGDPLPTDIQEIALELVASRPTTTEVMVFL